MAIEDSWESFMFTASWGGIDIDIIATGDSEGRDIVRHAIPHTDGALLEDVGGRTRTTSARIVFFEKSATDDDYMQRFDRFRELQQRGVAAEFVHPVNGIYQARVEDFKWSANADERGVVTVECTFIEDQDAQPLTQAGPGAPIFAGVEEVEIEATGLTSALAEVATREQFTPPPTGTAAPTSTVGATATATATTWQTRAQEATAGGESGATTALKLVQQLTLELDSLSTSIQDEMTRLSVTGLVTRWPILVALTRLNYALRRAFQTFVQISPRLFEVTVSAPVPLLTLAARIYGADEALVRYDQMLALNQEIRNPARLQPGTTLRAVARDPKRSPRLRAA